MFVFRILSGPAVFTANSGGCRDAGSIVGMLVY